MVKLLIEDFKQEWKRFDFRIAVYLVIIISIIQLLTL